MTISLVSSNERQVTARQRILLMSSRVYHLRYLTNDKEVPKLEASSLRVHHETSRIPWTTFSLLILFFSFFSRQTTLSSAQPVLTSFSKLIKLHVLMITKFMMESIFNLIVLPEAIARGQVRRFTPDDSPQ